MRKAVEKVDQVRLRKAVEQLDPSTRAVVVLRLGLDGRQARTGKETAELLGLSQEQVSRRLKNAVVQLRKILYIEEREVTGP